MDTECLRRPMQRACRCHGMESTWRVYGITSVYRSRKRSHERSYYSVYEIWTKIGKVNGRWGRNTREREPDVECVGKNDEIKRRWGGTKEPMEPWNQKLDGFGGYRRVFLIGFDGLRRFDCGEGGEESVEVRGYGGWLEEHGLISDSV